MATDTTGAHLKAPLASGIPVLLIDRLIESLRGKVSAVIIDNVHAASQAVEKLTSLGHKQIGLVLGSPNLYTTNQRLTGYLNALNQAGIKPTEEYIRYGDYTMDGGYQAVLDLLKLKNRPTALFVTNFEMTLGTMLALQHNGVRVPEDLSVIGFDKLELFGEIFPNLTLIRQPQLSIGREAANLMLNMLSNDESGCRIVTLTTELTEGSSIRPLKK